MEAVLRWFSENVAPVSSIASLLMVLVWIFYANLFYRDFRSRHHPRIMIHQAPDNMIDSTCFVVNMSQKMVNIAGVFIAEAETGSVVEITDYRHFASGDYGARELTSVLKQGPLDAGQFLNLGTFEELLSRLPDRGDGDAVAPGPRVVIRVAMYHGSAKLPAGAYRVFSVRSSRDSTRIRPETLHTVQMSSRGERRKVRGWLEVSEMVAE